VACLAYLSDIFSHINESKVKLQSPDTTIFNSWNKIQSFKKKLKLWLNMTAEGNIDVSEALRLYHGSR
jgi:hypothetical protein